MPFSLPHQLTEAELIEGNIINNRNVIMQNKIDEAYFMQKFHKGDKAAAKMVGECQARIKHSEEVITFLSDRLRTLPKNENA
jgi:hypothetical protein